MITNTIKFTPTRPDPEKVTEIREAKIDFYGKQAIEISLAYDFEQAEFEEKVFIKTTSEYVAVQTFIPKKSIDTFEVTVFDYGDEYEPSIGVQIITRNDAITLYCKHKQESLNIYKSIKEWYFND